MSLRPARRACGRAPRATALFPPNWEGPTHRAKCRSESVKPSEQRGGTTPDESEAREKGMWARTASDGIVPAELGGSDAPREMQIGIGEAERAARRNHAG